MLSQVVERVAKARTRCFEMPFEPPFQDGPLSVTDPAGYGDRFYSSGRTTHSSHQSVRYLG